MTSFTASCQLMDSDLSSFKAQIKAPEPGPLPEIVPGTTATSQAVKKNFIRIQEEIEALLASHRPGAPIPAPATAPAHLMMRLKK